MSRTGSIIFAFVCLAIIALVIWATIAEGQQPAPANVPLTWTTPGDRDTAGVYSLQCAEYDLRWSRDSIKTLADFLAAVRYYDTPTPGTPGTPAACTVRALLSKRKYYFAIRTRDSAGLWSDLSNIRGKFSPDTEGPENIQTLN